MVEFANQGLNWLESILELANGIPSHDTFNRVLQIVDCKLLTNKISKDGAELIEGVKDKLVSFDGKKIRGSSKPSRKNKGLYILNAWVGENKLCIGEKKVADKSNEITAIPQLIDELDLKGSLVSIDAMGCQVDIAEKIVGASADYLLAVKGNQDGLLEEISDEINWINAAQKDETWEYDHGRYEVRKCQVVSASKALLPQTIEKWKDVKSIVKIEAQRQINDVTSSKTRYYISSVEKEPAYFNKMVQRHWNIENHLHWHLDVTFNEDASRSRKGNAPINLNILRKMALYRISKMTDKLSFKKRRYRASMNPNYLFKLLNL